MAFVSMNLLCPMVVVVSYVFVALRLILRVVMIGINAYLLSGPIVQMVGHGRCGVKVAELPHSLGEADSEAGSIPAGPPFLSAA